MKYRVFVVLAFDKETDLIQFKKAKNADLISERKLAVMEITDGYTMDEVVGLFEVPHHSYLVYELLESVDELVKGKNLQDMDAS